MESFPAVWFDLWKDTAKKAADNGQELVVFSIPANKVGTADPETVEEIELLLQKKFPQYANPEHPQTPDQE